MPRVNVERDRCKGCMLCVENCPQKVLEMSKEINVKGYFFASPVRPHSCVGCCLCAIICPDMAIEIAVHGIRYHWVEY